MDQTNQQTLQTNNTASDGYLVTQKVDPSSLPTNQVNKDLDALKKAEAFMTGRLSTNATLNNPIVIKDRLNRKQTAPTAISTVADSDKDQVLKALALKNPFRGE